jgi:hypothetical protein
MGKRWLPEGRARRAGALKAKSPGSEASDANGSERRERTPRPERRGGRLERLPPSAADAAYLSAMNGYVKLVGGTNVSLIVRAETHRNRFRKLPALSFVPEPRAPPNGCCPTTAPVGLSLM